MEESEKRRERLRAMRMEAQAEVSSNTSSPSSSSHKTIGLSTPSSLSNPLLEKTQDDSHAEAPRFGFYTDPMSAFSSHKRPTGHQPRAHCPPSPGNPNFSPPGLGRGGSPSPNMGRGRCQLWDGNRIMSPAPRYSGGRGRCSNFARSHYDKSMVEDPWESLTPVIWRVLTNLNNRAFVQRTPMVKKPRFDTSNSNQSLAEFLAASLDEAVGDATTE